MLVKLLGFLDVFIAVCFWLFGILNLFPGRFIMILGFILLIKGLIFIIGFSAVSILDVIFGILIAVAPSVALPKWIVIIISLFIVQKGIFSLL